MASALRIIRVPCVTLAELVARLGNGPCQLVADIEAAILFRDVAALARCQTATLELPTTRHQGK